mmetsp:Transcript_19222/g.27041  ORF Transcript_19222/g.27041 Transcript_19222/m.27041 type:complete len:495 (-) Transcript_19222:33-1517(-)
MEDPISTSERRAKKEEAKRLKRKRIEEAGGVRPRKVKDDSEKVKGKILNNKKNNNSKKKKMTNHNNNNKNNLEKERHRFGRVMENVPCPNQARMSTLSIAIPGSIIANAQTRELRTHLVGQIARAAAVYHVDEIIVFDDKLSMEMKDRGGYRFRPHGPKIPKGREREDDNNHDDGEDKKTHENAEERVVHQKSDPHAFFARILQYCECPQYLRRHFFPMHPDLQFAGLLPPLDAPHHVRSGERSKYREGVVLDKRGNGPDAGSLVNCGIRSQPVEIDKVLAPGIRCTVKIDPKAYGSPRRINGIVVSPSAPTEEDGTYWGYTTRMAMDLNAVFSECPFGPNKYDLKIGTSERGNVTVDDEKFGLPSFRHSLVVFGGVAGIEECVDADESMSIPGEKSNTLFDIWLNTCPYQGSRTIRTEEAVLITLSRLRPHILKSSNHVEESKNEKDNDNGSGTMDSSNTNPDEKNDNTIPSPKDVVFSDEDPSDESSVDLNE